MELDFILLERMCLERYNKDIDQPIPINLRDAQVKVMQYSNTPPSIDCQFTTGTSKNLSSMYISMTDYTARLRQERIEGLGI